MKYAVLVALYIFTTIATSIADSSGVAVKSFSATYTGPVFASANSSLYIMLVGDGMITQSKVIVLGYPGIGLDNETEQCLKSYYMSGEQAKVTGTILEYDYGGQEFKNKSITYCGPKYMKQK